MGDEVKVTQQEKSLAALGAIKGIRYNDLYRPIAMQYSQDAQRSRVDEFQRGLATNAIRQGTQSDAQARRAVAGGPTQIGRVRLGDLNARAVNLDQTDQIERGFNAVRHGLGISSQAQSGLGKLAALNQQSQIFQNDLRHNARQQNMQLAGDLFESGVAAYKKRPQQQEQPVQQRLTPFDRTGLSPYEQIARSYY